MEAEYDKFENFKDMPVSRSGRLLNNTIIMMISNCMLIINYTYMDLIL